MQDYDYISITLKERRYQSRCIVQDGKEKKIKRRYKSIVLPEEKFQCWVGEWDLGRL